MTEGDAAAAIIRAGHRMNAMGWVPATAGNLSVRLDAKRLVITRSGNHKGFLEPCHVMVVDLLGRAAEAGARSSAETLLHCGAYRRFPEVGAVLHGHSVPATVLSRVAGADIRLASYELLKAFPGLPTHEAGVDLPVLDNDQDISRLQDRVETRWRDMAGRGAAIPPGYLIRGHGLYVWGPDIDAALARLEGLEFMLACELAAAQVRGGLPP